MSVRREKEEEKGWNWEENGLINAAESDALDKNMAISESIQTTANMHLDNAVPHHRSASCGKIPAAKPFHKAKNPYSRPSF